MTREDAVIRPVPHYQTKFDLRQVLVASYDQRLSGWEVGEGLGAKVGETLREGKLDCDGLNEDVFFDVPGT